MIALSPELQAYDPPPLDPDGCVPTVPMNDEPFLADWDRYAAEAEREGVWTVLRRVWVPCRFPVRAGISQTEAYRRATRSLMHTDPPGEPPGVQLEAPEAVTLDLHPTPAGRVPVIATGTRGDFERLLQALTMRNEPRSIPRATGAMLIGGAVNWERVHRLRRHTGASDAAWPSVFRAQPPSAYRDAFILCGPGPYSGIPASAVGMSEDAWLEVSMQIRRAHEAAHYAVRRRYGPVRSTAYDELGADYVGITAACGRFRADWFLAFMGLARDGCYRAGGRLEAYRGDPTLSAKAFRELQGLVRAAAANLEAADLALRDGRWSVPLGAVLAGFARMTLAELARPEGGAQWRAAVDAAAEEEHLSHSGLSL